MLYLKISLYDIVFPQPFDGSGNFNRSFPPGGWQGDAAASIKIKADRHDQHDADLASGLSNALCKDGQSQVTANIPWNGFRITNLGTPSAPTDAVTKAYVDTAATTSAYVPPIGGGMEFWGPTPPPKWLLAHGQAISRVTYSQLFAVFGTGHGAGDGSTTFNMPDVRGRVIAAADAMGGTAANRLPGYNPGVAGGAATHTLALAEMPAHTHNTTIAVSGTTSGRSAAHTHSVPLYDSAASSTRGCER
jgi:microcystin-dependent protein